MKWNDLEIGTVVEMLTEAGWATWREENPDEVKALQARLSAQSPRLAEIIITTPIFGVRK
jgi:hypothetical protein